MPDSVRHLRTLKENMEHRHADLLQAVDKAKIVCTEAGGDGYNCPLGKKCGFNMGHVMIFNVILPRYRCGLDEIEKILKREE